MSNSRWVAAVGMTIVVSLAIGCTNTPSDKAIVTQASVTATNSARSSDPSTTYSHLSTAAASTPLMAVETAQQAGDSLRLVGTLQVASGCVYLKARTGERVLPIFPPRTSWSGAGIIDRHGRTYSLGEEVSGTGTAAPIEVATEDVPAECVSGITHAWYLIDLG